MDIEALIDQNRSDFELSKKIKEDISAYLEALPSADLQQGKNFLVQHTRNIDTILTHVYRYILRKMFGAYMPLLNTIPITIVAMGSYGREQLCIHSDIDMMILYKETPGYNLVPIIELLLQILWDSGLKLGHRVHEIDTLFDISNSDHTIKTALLESRFVCGSKHLWVHTEQILKRIRLHEPIAFIEEKLQERESVRRKHPFSMQPDIKSSPGGLRDLNLLFWIAKIRFNVTRIKDLPPEYMTEGEYRELMGSMEYLFRVRIALHMVAGRKNDRLLLEYVPEVADKLGLDQVKTVQKTFEAMHHIRNISAILIKRLTHTLFYDSANIPLLRADRIGKNHYRCEDTHYGSLHCKRTDLLKMLESLLPFADGKERFDISYISMLKFADSATLSKERLYPILRELFYREYSAEIFKALYDAGQLFRVVAPLRKVAWLPQFDGYHTHPVDLHSIYTLQALESIKDPRVAEIYTHLSPDKKVIVRLSAFLHDCGKGRKTDHSILGANIARRYALSLGFTEEAAKATYTLIRYHTLMSNTAHREDIYSEKVIFSFIARLGTQEILDMLYVLTYADIASVSKEAWSPNNARLLFELYRNASEACQNRQVLNEAARRNKKEQQLRKFAAFTLLPNLLQKKILGIESNLFFLKLSPEQIVEISAWAYGLKSNFDYRIGNEEMLRIDIIRTRSVNLGYILSRLSTLSVVNMDIFYLFNGIKYFSISFDERIDDDEMQYIRQILDETLLSEKKPKLKPLDIKPKEITIDCNHSRSYAKMKIVTKDQKGLMANIMTTFDDIDIDIASAKIQTIKKRARNLFLIEKNGNFCTNREHVVKKITTTEKKDD